MEATEKVPPLAGMEAELYRRKSVLRQRELRPRHEVLRFSCPYPFLPCSIGLIVLRQNLEPGTINAAKMIMAKVKPEETVEHLYQVAHHGQQQSVESGFRWV